MPAISDLHVDSVLQNLSIQYRNPQYIAREILPAIKVNKPSDLFYLYDKADHYTQINTLVDPHSEAPEFDWGTSTDTFSVRHHAARRFIPIEEQEAADAPLDVLMDSTELATDLLDLDEEIKCAALVFASGSYGSSQKATPTVKWGSASSTPVSEIFTGIDATYGNEPLYCAIGIDAWRVLQRHPDVLAAFQLSTGGGVVASKQMVANYFGFTDIFVGEARKNTASKGQTASYSRIWDDHMLIYRRATSATIRRVSLGYTFLYGNNQIIREEDRIRGAKGGEWIKATRAYDQKLVATDAAYLIYDVVA